MRKPVIGIALLIPLAWGFYRFVFSPNPFGEMEAGIVQTKSPLSKAEAEALCPIALPEGATNIQYAVWSLWQASQTFVRFEAPVEVCLQHAEDILKSYSRNLERVLTHTNASGPISMPLLISPGALNLTWFDLPKFTAGLEYKLITMPTPTVWVDTNRGCFYYLLNE